MTKKNLLPKGAKSMNITIAEIPKGARSLSINIVETTDKKGKTIFEIGSISYYGVPRKILEIQLGDSHVESKGYPGIK